MDANPSITSAMLNFGKKIVDETKDIVGFYKPNLSFFSRYGDKGFAILRELIQYINRVAPDVPIILDAKYCEIDNSNLGYVDTAFDYLGADAVTISPYMGYEAMKPLLDCKDKGIIILCRTSNQGAGELQDLQIGEGANKESLFSVLAGFIFKNWNYNNNCLIVVGATAPNELRMIRKKVGDMGILIPGFGSQGGDLNQVLDAGLNSLNGGVICNNSRALLYASSGLDFAEATRNATLKFHNEISFFIANRNAPRH
jgi:orotidine-5'-phosphate decarboxylase